MRTTLTSLFVVFLALGAEAQTKFTTNNISTAAPPSGSVNLASGATPAAGTALTMMRSDAALTVTGVLPQANGGSGAGALTCTNQFITSNGTLYSCQSVNVDSTLTGDGIGTPVGIALSHANTWTALQTFTPSASATVGITATGTTTAPGGSFTGGGTGSAAYGVSATGTGSSAGISATGGGTGTGGPGGVFIAAGTAAAGITATGSGTGNGATVIGGSPSAGSNGGLGLSIVAGTTNSGSNGLAGGFGLQVSGTAGTNATSSGPGGTGGYAIQCTATGNGGNANTTGVGGDAGVCFSISTTGVGGQNASTSQAGAGGNLFSNFTLGAGGAGLNTGSTAGTGGGLGVWTLGNGGLGASGASSHGGNGGGWTLQTGAGAGTFGGLGIGGNGGSIFITLGNAGGSSAGGGTGGAFSVTAGNGGISAGGGGSGGGITFIAGNGNSTNGSGANITHTGGNGSGTATNGSGLISASGSGGTGTLHGYAAEFVQNNAVNGHLLFTGIASNPTHAADGSEWYITNTAFRFFQNATAVSLLNTGTNTTDNAATVLPSGTGSYTHTSTAGTARAGWRQADTRLIKWTSNNGPADCAGGTLNLTVAQLLDQGGFVTCATAQTINFPTWQGASGIVQNLPGTPAIGDVIGPFRFVATAANALTIGLGTGGTNGGANLTVAASTTRDWYCRITNVTASSEAATCY